LLSCVQLHLKDWYFYIYILARKKQPFSQPQYLQFTACLEALFTQETESGMFRACVVSTHAAALPSLSVDISWADVASLLCSWCSSSWTLADVKHSSINKCRLHTLLGCQNNQMLYTCIGWGPVDPKYFFLYTDHKISVNKWTLWHVTATTWVTTTKKDQEK
jgi:hypothetical protein